MFALALAVAFAGDGNPEIVVVPLASPAKITISRAKRALEAKFKAHVIIHSGTALPKSAYYPPRDRYRAEKVNDFLMRFSGTRVVGITDRDISTTLHGQQDYGVMGLAKGRVCVTSSFRSKARVGKVAVHEVGHTLGLPHCATKGCVMQDAKGTGRIANSSGNFCPNCASSISRWLRE